MLNLQLKKLVSGLAIAFISATLCLPNLAFASDRPIRVIFDRDGAFEDYYAILTLALASQQDSPPVKLIGITTMAHGESYCHNSEGYPELKQELLGDFSFEEGSIDGLTQKVLAIAQYREAKIYSGGEPLTIATVGPVTNLARAYSYIERNPQSMVCPQKIKRAVEFIGKACCWRPQFYDDDAKFCF